MTTKSFLLLQTVTMTTALFFYKFLSKELFTHFSAINSLALLKRALNLQVKMHFFLCFILFASIISGNQTNIRSFFIQSVTHRQYTKQRDFTSWTQQLDIVYPMVVAMQKC